MNRTRAWASLALLLMLASGCETQLFDPSLPQGIEGIALLGPQCPVQSQANPCPDLPHQAWIDVLDEGRDLVVRVRSGEDGAFRAGLLPGSYVLRPEAGNPFPTASEQPVLVEGGAYTQVVVGFDTGIR